MYLIRIGQVLGVTLILGFQDYVTYVVGTFVEFNHS